MTTAKRQRIRVCLRSYEHKLVDVSAEKIVETAKRTDAKVAGPIPFTATNSETNSSLSKLAINHNGEKCVNINFHFSWAIPVNPKAPMIW